MIPFHLCPDCGSGLNVCFGDKTVYVECSRRGCLFTQGVDKDEIREAAIRTYVKETERVIA